MSINLNDAMVRIRLRNALTNHPDWAAKRDEFGWKINMMSPATMEECAHTLGINLEDAVANPSNDGAPAAPPSETATMVAAAMGETQAAPQFWPQAAPQTSIQVQPGHELDVALDALRKVLLGGAMSPEQIAKIVDQRINKAFEGIPQLKIELTRQDGVVHHVEGHQHPKFKTLLVACAARRSGGKPLNILISGPAASGKTYACEMAAEALGLPFYFHSSVTATFEVMGWRDAAGKYHRTHFRDAFENGGVCLLDEVDSYDPNATMALNAPLENGICAFPDAIVQRHPDCIIIATANTWGLGATSDYVGRNKLDGAFRDRFHVRLGWDYDVALEFAISGNDAWVRRVQSARARARAAGLKVLITPRASQAGAALIAQGLSADEAAELTYLADLSKDQRKQVEGV